VTETFEQFRVDVSAPGSGQAMAAALRERGLVTFEGVSDRRSVHQLANAMMRVWHHRDAESDGVTVIRDRGEVAKTPGQAGFGTRPLDVHTESSGTEAPPELMLMACGEVAASGGDCLLVDGAEAYRQLKATDPGLLDDLMAERSALFGGSAGHLGSVFADVGDGRIRVRLRLDDLVKFSPQITHRLPELRRILNDVRVSVRLAPGHGYLLVNSRWMHGRTQFTGDRLMWRLLGDPLATLDVPAGFTIPTLARAGGLP
jgi:alpha-ketoglutarate-dependent taurine dioxygenase